MSRYTFFPPSLLFSFYALMFLHSVLFHLVSVVKLHLFSLWQVGEDVPDARKCACASHVATIADFFQVRIANIHEHPT